MTSYQYQVNHVSSLLPLLRSSSCLISYMLHLINAREIIGPESKQESGGIITTEMRQISTREDLLISTADNGGLIQSASADKHVNQVVWAVGGGEQ